MTNKHLILSPSKTTHNNYDLMWVPVTGKETEIWAARSPDGKRNYNIRKEGSSEHFLWTALWSSDHIPNVFAMKFINQWDARNACQELENTFIVDPKEVAEEKRRLSMLNHTDWCFQGVYGGMSIWTLRHPQDTEKCYVIINDRVRRPTDYSLSIRWRVPYENKNYTKLKMESLGVYQSFEKAQKAVLQIRKS